MSLYLPISFADTYYNVQLTGINAQKSETVIYSPNVFITKTTSSFQFGTLYNAGGDKLNEWTSWSFNWFAIGRWK